MARTIGVFINQLEDAYQTGVWQGIVQRATERGLGVTCFVGRGDHSEADPMGWSSVAFRIASAQSIAGLIRLSNTIGDLADDRHLAGLPQVSLGSKLPGMPSVTVDSGRGLSFLVRHLVEVHGRRRFALVTGPAGHGESEEREGVIRGALEAAGLALDDDLIRRGTFFNTSGLDGVRQLLAAGKPFDVLMALNDRMALGALEALAEAGLRVPEDVAVTGFDNIEQCEHVLPTLTTVDQPLHTMGGFAVDMLADLMEGRVPSDRIVSCEPVVRWSCGCPPRAADLLPPQPDRPWSDEAVERLVGHLRTGAEAAFLQDLGEILEPAGTAAIDGWGLVDHLEARAGATDPGVRRLANLGRRMASDARVRSQAARVHHLEDRSAMVRGLSARIAGSFGRERFLQTLREGWEQVGIRRGYLVLFDLNGLEVDVPPLARVVIPADGTSFATRDLLSPRWGRPWDRGRWVFEPLVYQEEPLGYLLLEETAPDLSVYAALRDQVTSTLKGALLLEALRNHERSLEEQIVRRTQALTITNEELRTEVGRRRILERQVQEISDRTMRRIGQDLHDDLCQHLAGVAMLATVVRRGLPDTATGAGESLDRIGVLLQDSILRARHIAQGLYPPSLEERGLADALEELLVGMRDTSPAALVFETEGDCRGGSPEGRLQMFRIVQEAVTNAIRHSGTDVVRVRLIRGADGLTASVTDFGTGMAARAARRGLGLSIMRYRADAAGLELRFEPLSPGLRVVCRCPAEEDEHG